MTPPPTEYRILALYRFVPLISLAERNPNNAENDGGGGGGEASESRSDESSFCPERHPTLRKLQSELQATLRRHDAKGTILIAPEGINGTICYPWTLGGECGEMKEEDVVAQYLKTHPLFGGPELRTRLSVWKDEGEDDDDGCFSNDEWLRQERRPQQAFHRLKIKIKAEIVTLGLGRPLIDRKPVLAKPRPKEDKDGLENEPTLAAIKNEENPTTTITSSISSRTKNGLSSPPISHDRHASNQLANPLSTKGQYLSPSQWDKACRDPDVLVIDTRNTYEIEIGTFESAVDPKTKNFSDFPEYLEKLAGEYDWSCNRTEGNAGGVDEFGSRDDGLQATSSASAMEGSKHLASNGNVNSSRQSNDIQKEKKPPPKGIAMFCTGGIRCEKATSYAIQSKLFPEGLPIYHLEGGILAYLDDVAKRKENGNAIRESIDSNRKQEHEMDMVRRQTSSSKSTFHGECFVFDKRVAVREGLKPSSTYVACHGCRGPMDHRLLLPPKDDEQNNSNVASTTFNVEAAQAYQNLSRGLSNLPSLRYDPTTQKHYLPGLTCPRCHTHTTRESLERFSQRERQMEICKREGRSHFEDRGG